MLENYSIEIRSDGDVYLSEHNRQRIRKFNPAGDFISTWSGNYGRLFTVENGNIYTINNGKIFQYTEQEEFIRKWNIIAGSGHNGNKHIAIEPDGDIYIVTHPRLTRHFSATGEHLDSSGSNANTKYATRFRSIATRVDGSLYTADSTKYLRRWDDSSTLIFGSSFPDPVIKFASDGSIFILTKAGNIKQFSAIGTLIHNWGNDAVLAKEGMLDRPKGLSVAPDGSVYVAAPYSTIQCDG